MTYTYNIINTVFGINNTPSQYISILYNYKGKTIETTCNMDFYIEVVKGKFVRGNVTDKNIKEIVLANIKSDIKCCKYWGLI